MYIFILKEGVVERMTSRWEIIAKNLFKKETNLQPFVNLKVRLSTGEDGVIESSFGLSGKVKIRIAGDLNVRVIEMWALIYLTLFLTQMD